MPGRYVGPKIDKGKKPGAGMAHQHSVPPKKISTVTQAADRAAPPQVQAVEQPQPVAMAQGGPVRHPAHPGAMGTGAHVPAIPYAGGGYVATPTALSQPRPTPGQPQIPPHPVGEAAGGPIVGPGGPTSDAIPAKLSNGEFVIKADVVQYLGQKFFQDLVAKAEAEMAQGAAPPGPMAEMAGATPGAGMDMTQ